jgi:ubiquinone biosynthesis protein
LESSQIRHPNYVTRFRNLKRIREISQVAVRHGFGYFFERHRFLALRPSGWRRRPQMPAQRGRHIREMLDELGPTFVKLGQVLSTRPDIVPSDVLEELVKLQDRVSPVSFSVASGVVTQELDLSIQRAFESFETEPLASASIGQVHGAVLPGGQRVVVKVQRPDAAKVVRRDVDLMIQLAELLEGRVDLGFSPTEVVQEFARSIGRELDYGLEARNAVRFALNFSDNEEVVVPRVYHQYCTKRLLTMERIDGPALNTPEVAALPAQERRELAEAIAECWFKQLLEDGFVHADPHPANLIHLGGRRFGVVDFGMTGSLRSDDLEEASRLFESVVHSDLLGIKRSLRRLGVQWNPSSDDLVTELIEESFSRYYGVSLSEIDVRALIQQVFDVVYSLGLRLPSRFLVLDKAALTLEGVVGQLSPELNLFDVARRFSGGLKRRLADPRRVARRVRRQLTQYGQVFSEYPLLLHDLMEEMRAGELEIKYRHTGLEGVVHRLDLVMNRLVVALVSIALGVSGTAVAILVEGGPHFAGLSVWGLPGFAGSFMFGLWLIWAILRSGRI